MSLQPMEMGDAFIHVAELARVHFVPTHIRNRGGRSI